jgi:hypothetical protein
MSRRTSKHAFRFYRPCNRNRIAPAGAVGRQSDPTYPWAVELRADGDVRMPAASRHRSYSGDRSAKSSVISLRSDSPANKAIRTRNRLDVHP